ncbi:hypothetical protein B296_00012946 [Ensete ventricosum]|uniref:Uncharacterized protein n=1 Tax=Ensete ventricosum TaxID=4639 RepID=A0A426Y3W0_ENSVE|nr:hypothetical protein B296_00012946 [Ensete ventricosum]
MLPHKFPNSSITAKPTARLQRQPPTGATPMSKAPVCRPPASRSCRLQGRPLAGAASMEVLPMGMTLAAKATSPTAWQGGCQRARATVACVGATAAQ